MPTTAIWRWFQADIAALIYIINMKTLPRAPANKLFDEWWNEMIQEWFKVEVLQDYTGEDDGSSLRKWLSGDKEGSIRLIKEQDYSKWANSCRKKASQGVKLIRIHIVDQPLTPYIQWEIEHYKLVNIPQCGERVYLLDRSELAGLDLPKGDIMIFDKKRVRLNCYDSKGLVKSAIFYDEYDNISDFLALRKKLIELARPL